MARTINALLVGIVVGFRLAAAQASLTGGSATSAITLQRAAAYLERSSSALDRLVSAIESGTTIEVDEALKKYTREFSQFHVTMAKLRIGEQELGFATLVVTEMESQISRLEALEPKLQPARAVAFGEAVRHLMSALQTITQKLDSESRSRLLKLWEPGWSARGTGPQGQEPHP